jgi:hypothetical protein
MNPQRERQTRIWVFALVGSMAAAVVLGAACGSAGVAQSTFTNTPDSAVAPGQDSSIVNLVDSGPGPDSAPPVNALTIQPQNETIDVPPTASVQFYAYASPGGTVPLTATWSVDQAGLGTIDQNGVFTPTGTAGGTLNVFAQVGQGAGTTSLRIRIHLTDFPSGLDGGTLAALQDGGTADPNFFWLYPYDQTVFPRGLLPPRLQWSGTEPAYVYVTAAAQNLDYKGIFAPTNTDGITTLYEDGGAVPQLDLPADAWTAITQSAGAKDPVTVQVTKIDQAGAVTGPITETWNVAQGSLTGYVYYDSYDSPLAQGDAGSQNDQGAVLRIKPGATEPEVFIGGSAKGSCTVCHSLSANGSTMALSAGHTYDAVYDVSIDASSPIGPMSTKSDGVYSFGALTPDGKYLLSCGSTGLDGGSDDGGPLSFPDYGPNVVSMTHELQSQLLDVSDGGVVGSLPGVDKALMPAFSPDGTKLAFNRYEPGQDQRLAVASFNESTLTFGAYEDVFVDPGFWLSWPTYLPDSQNFVFMVSSDTDQYSSFQGYSYGDANGQLLFFFSAIHDVGHLRRAMGSDVLMGDAGAYLQTYLRNPDGTIADQDTQKAYEPTSLPVAAGGYYWVVFTSRRSYGNTIDNSRPNDTPDAVKPKKLWVTAIDINGTPGQDWSHPAFYLPGQELGGGNIRAFWTLPPCAQNGSSCTSGTDCCGGFCRQVSDDGGVEFACVPPPPAGCSYVNEKCTSTAECCNAAASGIDCIGGFCAIPTPK